MLAILNGLALGLYALAAVLLVQALLQRVPRLPRRVIAVVAAGAAVHAIALAGFQIAWGEPPLVGLGASLSTLAFLIAIGSLIVATLSGAGPLGLVLVPVAALLLGAANAVGVRPMGEPMLFRGPWLMLHVVLALAGYAGLTLAFAAGLMYLLQFRELKSKRFGAIFHFFPPLETLDRIGKQALLVGFPAITLAVILGWAWAVRFPSPVGPGNPHIAWGVLSWAVFVAALLSRTGGGRRAQRAAATAVFGFVVIVLAFLLLRVQLPQGGAFL